MNKRLDDLKNRMNTTETDEDQKKNKIRFFFVKISYFSDKFFSVKQ